MKSSSINDGVAKYYHLVISLSNGKLLNFRYDTLDECSTRAYRLFKEHGDNESVLTVNICGTDDDDWFQRVQKCYNKNLTAKKEQLKNSDSRKLSKLVGKNECKGLQGLT